MNMQKSQQGFTLIELMIVVAIIGILASIAIPAYQDYTVKAKVSEAASLASTAKTAITLAFNEGSLSNKSNNASLNLPASTAITGKYVKSITAAGVSTTSGTVTVAMQGTNNAGVDGKNIVWTATCVAGAQCTWKVTGTVDKKFLPTT